MATQISTANMAKTEIRKPWITPKVQRTIGLILLQILLTVVLITFLIPAIWMISSSLKASTEVFAHPIVWIPKTPQWRNYVKIFDILPFCQICPEHLHRYRDGSVGHYCFILDGWLQFCAPGMAGQEYLLRD